MSMTTFLKFYSHDNLLQMSTVYTPTDRQGQLLVSKISGSNSSCEGAQM